MASLVRSDATLLSFHAGAIACDGYAAAIVGESTAGKTTTTIACARRGMSPYSDERLLLRDGMVLPFMRAFNVRPGGRALLGHDDAFDDFAVAMRQEPEDADWTDVSLFEVIRNLRKPQPAPLCAVFILQAPAGEASVTEIDPRRATAALMSCADCAAQTLLPEIMADDDDVIAPGLILFGRDHTALRGLRAKHRKEIGCDVRPG